MSGSGQRGPNLFHADPPGRGRWLGAALARAVFFFGLWLLLSAPELGTLLGGGRADQAAALAGEFAVALLATVAATWVSLWASPPAPRRWRLRALFPLLGRFLLQSLLGGLDIARRAFDPRLPLRPGYVVFPTRLRGARRLALLQTFSSATPGAIAAGVNAQGDLVFHCLDTRLPVAEVLARDEQHLQQLFREDASR